MKRLAQISAGQVSSSLRVAAGLLFHRHHTSKEAPAFAFPGSGSGQPASQLRLCTLLLLRVFLLTLDSFSSRSLGCSYLQSDSSKDFQRHVIDMLEEAEVVSTMLIPGAYTLMTGNQHSL